MATYQGKKVTVAPVAKDNPAFKAGLEQVTITKEDGTTAVVPKSEVTA